MFGRGGEEALALRAAGIPFEVVPGRDRGRRGARLRGHPGDAPRAGASAVAFVTGHEDPDKPTRRRSTGTRSRRSRARSSSTWASRAAADRRRADRRRARPPTSRRRSSSAGTLPAPAHRRRDARRRSPSASSEEGVGRRRSRVVGAGRRAARASWRGSSAGRCRAHASRSRGRGRRRAAWRARLRELGARGRRGAGDPRPRQLPGAGRCDPAPYDLVCLTSPNGVRAAVRAPREPAGATRARWPARGRGDRPGHGAALREHGIAADVVPERFVAEGLVEALADVAGAQRALVARARGGARRAARRAARSAAREVDVLALYETVAEPLDAEALSRRRARRLRHVHLGLDGAPSSTGGAAARPRSAQTRDVVSIGPVTSEALREHGLEPDVEADRARHRRPGRGAAGRRRLTMRTARR